MLLSRTDRTARSIFSDIFNLHLSVTFSFHQVQPIYAQANMEQYLAVRTYVKAICVKMLAMMSTPEKPFDKDLFFRALADRTRLRLLNLMRSEGSMRLLLRGGSQDTSTEDQQTSGLPSKGWYSGCAKRRAVDALPHCGTSDQKCCAIVTRLSKSGAPQACPRFKEPSAH